MIQKIIFFILLIGVVEVQAQKAITFSSDKLQQISQQYTGSSLNWPVVVNLAEHNISDNSFKLSSASLLKLQNLSKISLVYQEQQKRLNNLIGDGATIFAKEELEQTSKLLGNYIEFIRNGDLENALEVGNSIKPAVDELEKSLLSNRLVTVQAQLSDKDGQVDKRLGLLAEWTEAFVGDFFEESDGIQTQQESYATLAFTDGSTVTVNPKTTAVIRKSRIDKLDKSIDTEITLVEGGLLSKLSAAGKEQSNYILNAGSSSTELKTQNFYAERSGPNDVKLSNYDGNAVVSSNNVIVTIKKNEGTIVRNNQAPLKPVKLLSAPQFYSSKNDTIIYKNNFIINFKSVTGAKKYKIEYSKAYNFDHDVSTSEISDTRLLLTKLAVGTTYVRVQSIDELGLKGPFSEVFRVIRNEDTQPPPIFGEQFSRTINFAENKWITLVGVSEPDAKITVDGTIIKVSNSGEFTSRVVLSSYDQIITVTATDDSQNKTIKEVRVAQLSEEYLFDIKINGRNISSELSTINSTKTITGKAFPEMEIELENNGNKKLVKTDSQGRWGITMNVQQGKLSVTFRANQKSTAILTKSYTVK